jgi:putative heme-binding domain-containing protein
MSSRHPGHVLLAALLGALPAAGADASRGPRLELRPGDHVCLLGNTLAERMQHDGWLDTYLHGRFPRHDLVLRNLGFSGDELTLRLRSQDFGSPDEWLTRCQADVVFAFFGYNESFAGAAGLEKFKHDLDDFVRHTLGQKYNGKSDPRLVLFSPIAHEDLHDPNLPDGRENNARLEQYTAATAEVAAARGVVFVDLFHPSRALYKKAARPLTINGIHLTEGGDRQIAQVIAAALFGEETPRDPKSLERLRRAVRDRNFHWFERYRTVDGYSIYGGRADLKFVDGQTNRVVMQREMEVLDVLTANRDRRVWAAARGEDLAVDDSNTPPFIPVKTNKPGSLPGGAHLFLGGEEAIQRMTVAKGMKVTLFASEKEFPELAKPVQMAFDTRGRLWVAAWPSYPHWKPKEEMNDKLLILEDTDGDGKADKCTVFADHLHCPTGFVFWGGGVLVAQAPDLLFLKDTDGDGKADVRVRVLGGLDSADTHHTSNSFVLDPGGGLYFQEGTFHHTQVESPYGPPRRCANAGVYRYEPRTQKFEVYVSFPFANPHGHVFDRWGQDIVIDGTGSQPYDAALFSGRVEFPHKHATPPQVYQQRTRPCPGAEYLYSCHFPADCRGDLLVANVIGFQGILRYHIADAGASFAGTEAEPLLYSSDPNFRPTDVKVGPDGAVWFIDWQNPIIGHMQHNLRDPSRDRTHGRVYRVTCEGRPLLTSPPVAGEPVAKLLGLLKDAEEPVRCRARVELSARDSAEVIAATKKWLEGLDRKDPEYGHCVLEALWLHQGHNVVSTELLDRVLASPDFRAQAAGARVLCCWRDRVPDALDRFKKLAADPHPRVRLEAVRAASFFGAAEAVEVPLIAAALPTDHYLDFVRGETMRTLEPYVRDAVSSGRPIAFTTDAGNRYFLKVVATADLVRMPRSEAVCVELLQRQGVRDEDRSAAVAFLAKLRGKSEPRVLLDTVRSLDRWTPPPQESVVFDLMRLLSARKPGELSGVRGDLEALTTEGRLAVTRQLGFVALVAADGSAEKAWARAARSADALHDLVAAMPIIRDPVVRASLYPKVEPLLDGLPPGLADHGNKAVMGRYVRIELPGPRRTLTLAEVEVFSDGRNVARQGKATQKNTAWGGDASRAIDGNTSGDFSDGSQTHSREGTNNPWWQVDLGREYPVDRVVVWNRTDGNLGTRLAGFTLKVLDDAGRVVFARTNLPAPAQRVSIPVGGESPSRVVRHAAMLALTSVRGQEAAAFKAIARFAGDELDRDAAVAALLRIPSRDWPKEDAEPLLQTLLAHVRKVPVSGRTRPDVLAVMQLADALAGLLPRERARLVRQQLGELGVRVLRLGTVTDQMLFDKERLAVRAGRPVEIVFENTDLMPHNFVVTRPGALEEVGNQAEAQAADPAALQRHYVPASDKVLLASRLLQPRETQTLRWTAPTTPGVYPYVCTFPGHWRRMHGALYVVDDLDDYLADPAAYLARHPLPAADPLLALDRPRTEWKYEDLVDAVAHLDSGRSFANARQTFQVASCVACHRLNGAGTEVGPDLAKLDPKRTPLEVLRDVLEPSFRIEDRYASYVFELESGKKITGMVLEETPEAFKVIENPLAKATPVVIRKSDVADRQKSPTSIMPRGLLDRLTREEVLDLLAYVIARGDPGHRLFRDGHDHAHAHGH